MDHEQLKMKYTYLLAFCLLIIGCSNPSELELNVVVNKLDDARESFPDKNWMWVRNDKKASEEELIQKFEKLVEHGFSGVLIAGDHERMFRAAKSVGLETHIWMWTMNRGDKEIMDNHSDWYAINRKGESCHEKPPYVGYYRWLCPTKKPVRNFLKEQVQKLVAKDYIDGIHLDYVRHCDVILPSALWEKYGLVQDHEMPEYDYCYCDDCKSHYMSADYGGKRDIDPSLEKDPPSKQEWVQFRSDMITEVVNELAEVCHAAGKPISAAVFPTPTIAKKIVRQDWVKWDLDMVFPMVYHAFYEEDLSWVNSATKEGVDALNGTIPYYTGLYMPDLKTAPQLDTAIVNALTAKANGFCLLGELSSDQWEVLKNH